MKETNNEINNNLITDKELKSLIEKAKQGLDNAYTPVRNFPVGAAVLTTKGNIYQGCNTESVISGLGVCAERSAIDHAVAHGEYNFKAIVVISRLEEPIKPCGACLQYINEFSQIGDINTKIYMVGSKGKIKKSSIKEMLPDGFGPKNLKIDLSRYRK